MYNLLVTAQEGAWDSPFYKYDRSRFLEYTNDDIATTYKNLTEKKIATLKSLPCIFAYEGTDSDIRIGRLKSIEERGRSILIQYEFYPTIPPISFADIEPIADGLDIRRWEMSRTHWAVKDEDLFERLRTAGIIEPATVELPEKSAPIITPPEPPAPPADVTTVQQFIERVLLERQKGGFEVFYRGHSNKMLT